MDSEDPDKGVLQRVPTENSQNREHRESNSSQVAQEVERIERRLSKAKEKSDEISSWLREPSQTLGDPNLPLTPPSLPQDSEEEPTPEKEAESSTETAEPEKSVADVQRVQTPVIQRSPPTPDQTPPRVLISQSAPQGQSTTTLSLRYPSSNAESFKTAQEQLGSEDEVRSGRFSQKEQSVTGSSVFGLGLEMSEGSATPTIREPSVAPKIRSLDESWSSNEGNVAEDPFVTSESLAVQQILQPKRPRRRRRRGKPSSEASSTPEDFQASLDRSMRLGDQKDQGQSNSSSSSVEKTTDHEQGSLEGDGLGIIHVDQKRLSELSNQSQVVQAVVVSTPPQRRQKLRHSSKNESLRTAGSPVNSSIRSSPGSNEHKASQQKSKSQTSEKRKRRSGNTDSGVSMGEDIRKKVEEVLPASEIPPRRSSLRSSKRRLQNLRSLVEAEREKDAVRPGTAPDTNSKSVFESTHRQRPATSDANSSALPSGRRGRKPKEPVSGRQPHIPPRSSSLSAPTSRNNSRTTSLTSTSLHKHNMQQQNMQPALAQRVAHREVTIETPEPRVSHHLSVENAEDKRASDELGGGKHRSLLTTPFSMASMQSSTTGPYEVNEATAIEIYPHNNTSVLVVQQLPPRKGSDQPRLSARLSGNVRINLEGFVTPPKPTVPGRDMESPLRNPREPPRPPPPVILIPPTPAQADSAPPSRGRRSETTPGSASGPFSTIRRALSARRYSESSANPFARPFLSRSRGNSVKAQRNRKKIEPETQTGKFSGFWNPRGFWNDLSDDEDEGQRTGFIRTSIRGPSDIRSNSLVRRLGSMRTRQKVIPAIEQDNRYISYGPIRQEYPRYDADADSYEEIERKVGVLSRIRATSHLKPFASLQEAIRDMKEKRTEAQLEKQRERLRRNIGPVILQQDARPFY